MASHSRGNARSSQRSAKPRSRFTTCFCFVGLLLASVLSLFIYASHLHIIDQPQGKQFLRYIEENKIRDVLHGVIDSMSMHVYPSNPSHTIDDPSEAKHIASNTGSEQHVDAVDVEDKKDAPTNLPVSTTAPMREIKLDFDEMHFIHIPKCGGTTMTAVLRQFQCQRDPERNKDCCTNPGFCDWHAMRRCSTIKGCINHFPNTRFLYKDRIPSITVFREPTSRLLSAWFYRGHSPNLDFFQVRPYFKDIAAGKLPKVTFDEYIEMVEYQNIQTRMLGADSFPYRNITINEDVFRKASEGMEHFFFVGLQEEFDLSAVLLARELGLNDRNVSVAKEREQQGMQQIKRKKQEITGNERLMQRVREVNSYDLRLYQLGK